jgi:UDP-N-acetylglucosamine 3-dehydrogenase
MSELAIALLGAGNMGTCLGNALLKIPNVALRYVCDTHLPAAEKLSSALGAVPVSSPDTLFSHPDFDAVMICLPTHTRLETLQMAVEAGKHIFCEKPLALNSVMAEAIRQLLTGYPKTVMVGQVLRFFWEYAQLRQLVLEGKIGQIGTIRLSRLVGYPGSTSWFTDESKSGGLLLDLLVHDLDFLLWTLGEMDQVFAQTVRNKRSAELDYALVTCRMKSGALAHLESSWAHPPGSFRQTVEIAGSQGLLSYDSAVAKSFELHSTQEKDGSLSRIALPPAAPEGDVYYLEMKHFVDCLTEGRPVSIPWQEALRACSAAFSAMESARSGAVVKMD